jgi:hypothetical protein
VVVVVVVVVSSASVVEVMVDVVVSIKLPGAGCKGGSSDIEGNGCVAMPILAELSEGCKVNVGPCISGASSTQLGPIIDGSRGRYGELVLRGLRITDASVTCLCVYVRGCVCVCVPTTKRNYEICGAF